MADIRRFLSTQSGPLAQFFKYGVIGVLSTLIQMVVFYLLASVWLKCLTPDDWAVRLMGLPSASFTGQEAWWTARGTLAAVDTAVGFTIANVFCWLMNRCFVFTPGKYAWYLEFLLFFGAALFATTIALGVMKVLIDVFGVMTTCAVVVEVVVSFFVNFFVRKFVIFKG